MKPIFTFSAILALCLSAHAEPTTTFPGNVVISGDLTVEGSGGGGEGGAPTDATYITTSANGTLSDELVVSTDVLDFLDSTNDSDMRSSFGLTALATTTPGTGIATALAINVGSAGAPVLFNGAGGTPSSITLTNGTGLPIAGTTGYGTGVATALAANINASGGFMTFGGGNLRTADGNSLQLAAGGGLGVLMNSSAEAVFTTTGFGGSNSSSMTTAMGNKVITDGTATAFVRVAVASGGRIGGTVWYTIEAEDGTDHQSVSGSFSFSAVNKAGTETCVISTVSSEAAALSSGTLSGTFDSSTSPTNAVDLRATWTSSLTQTAGTYKIWYRVVTNKAATLTPQ